MKLNKKLEYCVAALHYLGMQPNRTASVRQISNACHIPEALLSKIMQRIKRLGVVHSIHGNQGGYQLSEDSDRFSLFQLSEILSDRQPRSQMDPVSPAVSKLQDTVYQLMASVSVKSLISRAAAGQ